tara:strand:+ start:1053 stop:1718 length:666 start_codon:yes stop_codon:yes gene_type:complete
MCGIFGASETSEFETLYDINKERGTFAFGSVGMTINEGYHICKSEGVVNLNENKYSHLDLKYIIGHTQAPTSCERDFTVNTTHPFEVGDWLVAHNGVLSNFNELKSKYVPWHTNNVDTSIIPALLNEFKNDDNTAKSISLISRVLNLLKGTFAVWILNTDTAKLFLARSGSTLFFNRYKTCFSSTQCKGWEPVKENTIYENTPEGFTEVGVFEGKHPFFML